MGWHFDWVSSYGSDFNYDFNASFTLEEIESGEAEYNYRKGKLPLEDLSGFTVFAKSDIGEIFHTYSVFGRGAEEILGTYMLMDLTPKGRDEGPEGHVSEVGRWVPAVTPKTCCG
jgi:predicted dithiol-disulfide oxidoreductase (DUF899 family)